MKVKKTINALSKVMEILKYYEDKDINEMLDDLHSKVFSNISPENKERNMSTQKGIDFKENIEKLKQMNKEEISQFLSVYKKAELISLGKAINISMQSRENKTTLIESISNHYSFIQLNEQMSNRNQKEIKAL